MRSGAGERRARRPAGHGRRCRLWRPRRDAALARIRLQLRDEELHFLRVAPADPAELVVVPHHGEQRRHQRRRELRGRDEAHFAAVGEAAVGAVEPAHDDLGKRDAVTQDNEASLAVLLELIRGDLKPEIVHVRREEEVFGRHKSRFDQLHDERRARKERRAAARRGHGRALERSAHVACALRVVARGAAELHDGRVRRLVWHVDDNVPDNGRVGLRRAADADADRARPRRRRVDCAGEAQ
mmetsp:Transcript_8274/g.25819  ORF Transcript_8274/g.25819 Transcript_8274/m.25819 type:complete len:241 (-) Transcript_8274:757-1479(-)